MSHYRMPILEEKGFVVLSRDAFRDVLLTLPRLGNKLLMLFLRAASQRLQLTEAWLPESD